MLKLLKHLISKWTLEAREKTALRVVELSRKLIIDFYKETDKKQFVDVLGVMVDKTGGILTSGFVKLYVPPSPQKYIRLRNMVRDTVMLRCGPVTPERPHKIILLPSPSFVWEIGKDRKKFFDDWPGTTYLGEEPYCMYTIMR